MLELNLPKIGDVKELCNNMAIVIEHCKLLPDPKSFETPSPTVQRSSPAEMIAESQKPFAKNVNLKKKHSNGDETLSAKKPKKDRGAIKSEIEDLKKELSEIPAERLKQHELDPNDIAAKNAITAKEWELKRKISQLEKLLE